MASRRCQVLDLSPCFLARFFAEGVRAFRVVKGLPADSTVVNAVLDFATGNVRLLVESAEFPEVAEGSWFPPHPGLELTSLGPPATKG